MKKDRLFWIATGLIGIGVEIVFNRRVEKLPDGGIIAIGPTVADAIAKGVLFETDLPDMAAVIADAGRG